MILFSHPVSNIVKKTILAWKFRHFDRDSDLHLNSQELFFLRREIYSFIKCIKFFPQIISIMDESDDGVIDLGEWKSFFEGKLILANEACHNIQGGTNGGGGDGHCSKVSIFIISIRIINSS